MTKNEDAKLMLILKFGSVAEAYTQWIKTHHTERHGFTDAEMNVLMNYEYYEQVNGPSPYEPR